MPSLSYRKLFLSYLVVIFLVTGLFLVLARFTDLSLERGYLPYLIVFGIIFIGILISYILTRLFYVPVDEIATHLKDIEKGKYEKICIKAYGEVQDVTEIINSISRKLKEMEQRVHIFFEITRAVSSHLHLQQVMDAIVDLVTKEFKLDACSIRMIDDDGKLRIKSHRGLSKDFVLAATRRPTIDSYSGECFITGKIVIVNDAEKIDKPISTNVLVSENIKSFALTPIKVEGDILGVLVAASNRKNYFHPRFSDLIYFVASQIGLAIKISQLYGEIYNSRQDLEKKVEERTVELEQKSRQLIESERLAVVGKMANRIAHEFRNSLTVIGGFSRRLCEQAPDGDENKRYLETIVEEVMTLEKKVSEMIKVEHR
ncbi:MAG: GAF domain-containing protein [Thermodesulfobacteriota bacterium]|nr:GAF domain-containing protein [Thermodesulfobacteriota bacterium]